LDTSAFSLNLRANAPVCRKHFPAKINVIRSLGLIFLAVAATIPAAGGVIYSYYDAPAPAGHSLVIGMALGEGRDSGLINLVTTAEIYRINPSAPPNQQVIKLLDATAAVPGLDGSSSVANTSTPNTIAYVARSGLQHLLVTFNLTNATTTTNVPTGLVRVAGMVEDEAMQVYVSAIQGWNNPAQGIMQYRSFTDTTLLRNIGGDGPGALTLPTFALAAGAGKLYALDEANSRVNRYDTTTGDYLGSFSVTGVTGSNAMVFDPAGLIYLSDGQGGAKSYDAATGDYRNTFQATSGSVDFFPELGGVPEPSRDAMVLDARGQLYVWDYATSFHAYDTIPEPGTLALAALGALLVLAHRRRA
jgi:uncharacterized membrane protein